MIERPEPRVVTVVREFKRGLLLQEAAHMQAMAQRWVEVEDSLASLIVDLAAQVDEIAQAGGTPSRAQIYRLERYRRLLTQAEGQFDRYADWASREIVNRQRQMAEQGLGHAVEAIQASYFPNVGVYFDRLPVEAIQNIIGLAGNGAPIGELLRDRMVRDAAGNPIPGVWDKLTEQLIRGVGLGYNPRKTARMMQGRLAGGLQKALTIARTEELRAYRFTNQQQYAASGVVIAHRRLSAHDGRVCPACIAADGETYPVGKVMDDHVQGRCTSAPVVRGMPRTRWLSGEDWFRTQDPEVQASILGSGRLEAWRDGQFDFGDLVTRTHDRVWGDGLVPTPLQELVG